MFNFRRVSEVVLDRKRKFLQKFRSCDNFICETLAFRPVFDLLGGLGGFNPPPLVEDDPHTGD